MQRLKTPQVNDVVKVNDISDVHYKLLKIYPDGFACEIAELKDDGSCYSAQRWDTTMLVKV